MHRSPTRSAAAAIGAVALIAATAPLLAEPRQRAGEVDTEHVFGQTTGADTEDPGAFVPHLVMPGRLGRRDGYFSALTPTLELKYGLMENFSTSVSLRGLSVNANNVPGLPNHAGTFATGFGVQGRYRFMDREKSPFGLTLQFAATSDQRNMVGGERGRTDQFEMRVAVDVEPVWDRLMFAANLIAGTGRSYVSGSPNFEMNSNLGMTFAGATRLTDNLWVGAEIIYQRAYSGSTYGRYLGDALFIGPTLYATFDKSWISVSWTTQVAGNEVGGTGPLNLRDFERHQFLAVIGRRF